MTDRLLTAREIAERINVSTETVLRWTRLGELPAIRLPSGQLRYREAEVEARIAEWATPSRGVSTTPASAARGVTYLASTTPEVEEN